MTQPTNSIDSELEKIIEILAEQVSNHMFNMSLAPELTSKLILNAEAEALQAIKALYRKEIEEAIGEDMTMKAAIKSHSDAGAGYTIGVNSFKAELRAKLLPPTKGGKDE